MHNRIKSVTLLELLVAIALVSIVVIGIASIELFSRYHVLSSDRKVKLQNEASLALEHMAKEIAKAVGDSNNSTVITDRIGNDTAIQVWIDYNQNGQRDAGDRRIAYRFTGSPSAYQIKYCPECTNNPCTNCNPNWNACEILSSKINSFSRSYNNDNYVEVELTACWDPNRNPDDCRSPDNPGSPDNPDNPSLSMKNRIYMPMVSTH